MASSRPISGYPVPGQWSGPLYSNYNSAAPRTSFLIPFYLGNSRDDYGRTLDQILSWDDKALEESHDYIQRLFPTFKPSSVDPNAPLLNQDIVNTFKSNDATGQKLRANLLRSFERMLSFYGFEKSNDGTIKKSDNFSSKRAWLSASGQHNFLRITRILTSLKSLGLQAEAQAFYQALLRLYRRETLEKMGDFEPNCTAPGHSEQIDSNTQWIWYNAVNS